MMHDDDKDFSTSGRYLLCFNNEDDIMFVGFIMIRKTNITVQTEQGNDHSHNT